MATPNKWHDHYMQKAQKEGFPARSVYKLKEIQQKYQLIRKGDRILDLGCAPGAWLLYAARMTGKNGKVIGVDLKPTVVKLPSHGRVVIGDVLAPETRLKAVWEGKFQVILSDMAPATTGNKIVDAAGSLGLCMAAWSIAEQYLLPGGAFVCKIFFSQDVDPFLTRIRPGFKKLNTFKPKSSRKASKEIYIIGQVKK
jgi:23S rRNA (uridine2552-2'-O)-methyltransferase